MWSLIIIISRYKAGVFIREVSGFLSKGDALKAKDAFDDIDLRQKQDNWVHVTVVYKGVANGP